MRRVVMPETGFFAQKRNSPTSLGLVILLHGALIAAVILVRSPAFERLTNPPTVVRLIPEETDPPRNPPPPRPDQPQNRQERLDQPPPPKPTPPTRPAGDHQAPPTPPPPTGPAVDSRPPPTQLAGDIVGSGTVDIPRLPPEPPAIPVRRAAQIDSSARLQPPYPPGELRLNRDGRVQVRVTI